MTVEATMHDKALQDAFVVFNQMSQQLAASYQELERQVAQLHHELAAARDERLLQLAEKERIANRLQVLWKSLPGGVVVIDEHGTVQECNPAVEVMFGKSLLGLRWNELVQREFVSHSQDGQDIGLRNGRFVNVSIQPLGAEPGRIVLVKDVTDARALRETEHRQQRLSAMGEMLASLAHQIRTPLASAMLYSTHLQRTDLKSEDQQRFAQRLSGRLHYLEGIVNDMLMFAKGEDECVDDFLIGSLLPQLRQDLHAQLHARAVEFIVNNQAKHFSLRGNAKALLGALTNLISNAIEASSHTITLDISTLNEKFLIVVEDDGNGISETNRERIFDPFFTTRIDGTGLGLAVVRAVVSSFKGSISVAASAHAGSRFEIVLPIATEQGGLMSGVANPAA